MYMAWRKGESGKALSWFVQHLQQQTWLTGLAT
jgi:hypothetical protein